MIDLISHCLLATQDITGGGGLSTPISFSRTPNSSRSQQGKSINPFTCTQPNSSLSKPPHLARGPGRTFLSPASPLKGSLQIPEAFYLCVELSQGAKGLQQWQLLHQPFFSSCIKSNTGFNGLCTGLRVTVVRAVSFIAVLSSTTWAWHRANAG